MGWSYSGDPGSSDKDEVRFYLGDTDETFQLLSDEEIQFVLDSWKDSYNAPLYAAAVAAEALAARFAREVSISADGVSVQIGELQQRYDSLANSLRDQYKAKFGMFDPSTAANILSMEWDPSLPSLTFGVGFMDNLWAGKQDYSEYHPGQGGGFPEVSGSNTFTPW